MTFDPERTARETFIPGVGWRPRTSDPVLPNTAGTAPSSPQFIPTPPAGPQFIPDRTPEQRLADAIERLADALLGWRTTTVGNVTVSERVVQRFEPRPCAKCASRDARVIFHATAASAYGAGECGRTDRGSSRTEHLHVYCQVCHFDWTEDVAKETP